MRYAGLIAAALLVLGCGPDPNAQLPGVSGSAGTGGTTTKPSGTGGTTAKGGSGGSSRFGSGGMSGTGGSPGSGGRTTMPPGSGGRTSSGGTAGSGGGGGTTLVGNGGTNGGRGGTNGSGGVTTTRTSGIDGGAVDAPGTGGVPGIDAGGGSEPCTPSKTITGTGSGNTGNFDTTGAFCFRTPDNISGWNCSNFDGRTLKVNGVVKACGDLPLPAKVNGYYYFDCTAGTYNYASIYWY
jgi:endoglucanase